MLFRTLPEVTTRNPALAVLPLLILRAYRYPHIDGLVWLLVNGTRHLARPMALAIAQLFIPARLTFLAPYEETGRELAELLEQARLMPPGSRVAILLTEAFPPMATLARPSALAPLEWLQWAPSVPIAVLLIVTAVLEWKPVTFRILLVVSMLDPVMELHSMSLRPDAEFPSELNAAHPVMLPLLV